MSLDTGVCELCQGPSEELDDRDYCPRCAEAVPSVNTGEVLEWMRTDFRARLWPLFVQADVDIQWSLVREFNVEQADHAWGATRIGDLVPAKFHATMPYRVGARFQYALHDLTRRIFLNAEPAPASRAEEMLLCWISRSTPIDFPEEWCVQIRNFVEAYLLDCDLLPLWRPSGELPVVGTGSLSMEDWFLPYSPQMTVDPFLMSGTMVVYPSERQDFIHPDKSE